MNNFIFSKMNSDEILKLKKIYFKFIPSINDYINVINNEIINIVDNYKYVFRLDSNNLFIYLDIYDLKTQKYYFCVDVFIKFNENHDKYKKYCEFNKKNY